MTPHYGTEWVDALSLYDDLKLRGQTDVQQAILEDLRHKIASGYYADDDVDEMCRECALDGRRDFIQALVDFDGYPDFANACLGAQAFIAGADIDPHPQRRGDADCVGDEQRVHPLRSLFLLEQAAGGENQERRDTFAQCVIAHMEGLKGFPRYDFLSDILAYSFMPARAHMEQVADLMSRETVNYGGAGLRSVMQEIHGGKTPPLLALIPPSLIRDAYGDCIADLRRARAGGGLPSGDSSLEREMSGRGDEAFLQDGEARDALAQAMIWSGFFVVHGTGLLSPQTGAVLDSIVQMVEMEVETGHITALSTFLDHVRISPYAEICNRITNRTLNQLCQLSVENSGGLELAFIVDQIVEGHGSGRSLWEQAPAFGQRLIDCAVQNKCLIAPPPLTKLGHTLGLSFKDRKPVMAPVVATSEAGESFIIGEAVRFPPPLQVVYPGMPFLTGEAPLQAAWQMALGESGTPASRSQSVASLFGLLCVAQSAGGRTGQAAAMDMQGIQEQRSQTQVQFALSVSDSSESADWIRHPVVGEIYRYYARVGARHRRGDRPAARME